MATRDGRLIGGSLFGGGLSQRDCYANEAALAHWGHQLAGETRALYEHVTGAAVGDNTACAELNSRGVLGEDHSGVGYGRELKHTFWLASWSPDGLVDPCTTYQTAPTIESGDEQQWELSYHVPVPSGYPGTRYASCQVTAVYICEADGTTGTATMSVATNNNAYQDEDIEKALGIYAAIFTVGMVPGAYNTLRIKMACDLSAGTYNADLISLAVSQVD
jgi:hypothetical protein